MSKLTVRKEIDEKTRTYQYRVYDGICIIAKYTVYKGHEAHAKALAESHLK